jgi:2,3-dihydroxy-p-cumate/2,3-dihydroxybenzoate 3,4-dioxygenase
LVFSARDRDAVDRLAANLHTRGHRLLAEPGSHFPEGEYGLACSDADGRECRVIAAPRLGATIDDPLMPINLSHIVLNTPQGDANGAFYTDGLGFSLTLSTSRFPMHFLRCDQAHHRIALWTGAPRAFLNHVAYEMCDIDHYLRRSGQLIKQGCKLIAGPGRHTVGENTYSYFLDPNMLVIEITTDMEQVTHPDDYVPKAYPPGGDQWGFGVPLDSPEMRQYTV